MTSDGCATWTSNEYADWQGDTFVVDLCAECGRPYSERIGIAPAKPSDQLYPEPQWHCPCGVMNEMKYHSDDCACTLGGENVCELRYYFEDASILNEDSPLLPLDDRFVVDRMLKRIHKR